MIATFFAGHSHNKTIICYEDVDYSIEPDSFVGLSKLRLCTHVILRGFDCKNDTGKYTIIIIFYQVMVIYT